MQHAALLNPPLNLLVLLTSPAALRPFDLERAAPTPSLLLPRRACAARVCAPPNVDELVLLTAALCL